jgi:hypothetical protein
MEREEMFDEILKKTGLGDSDIVAAFQYGSHVYGTARKNSDYDFIVITNKKRNEQYSDRKININFYTYDEHQQRLNDHEISALECAYWLPHGFIVKNPSPLVTKPFTFELDLVKLRHSLSAKSSNSWVKAKKKLTVEKDYDLDLGRKSLFHSFRIIDFGIQIATHGRIIDYNSCNYLFCEIMNCYTWDQMFDQYKERYNTLCSDFRKVAPKV